MWMCFLLNALRPIDLTDSKSYIWCMVQICHDIKKGFTAEFRQYMIFLYCEHFVVRYCVIFWPIQLRVKSIYDYMHLHHVASTRSSLTCYIVLNNLFIKPVKPIFIQRNVVIACFRNLGISLPTTQFIGSLKTVPYYPVVADSMFCFIMDGCRSCPLWAITLSSTIFKSNQNRF